MKKTIKKIIKISVVVMIVILILAFIAFFANALFGNPISKHLAKTTAIEYIEENYPDDNCHIEYINYDFKYENYNAHIISTTNENIDFSLNITPKGEVAGIEYWKNPVESATPLTEGEIKELFLDAHKLYVEWSSPAGTYLNKDWNNTTIIDGVEYFEVVSTEITSVDELRNEYSKYFSEEIVKENIDKYYVMYNGKMYGNAVLVEGGEIPSSNYELTVHSNTSTECNFTVSLYIEDSKDELYYKLKVIDGKWKFTEIFPWVTMDESFAIS